jgi:hypothetical protein
MTEVILAALLLVGCGSPASTPVPSTATPAGATILGQIVRTDEVPRITIVIPCLMVADEACRVQPTWVARVSDEGAFEIAGIAPGTYTFFYGPDSAEDSRAAWEDRLVNLEDPVKIARSFDLDVKPVGCRHLGTGEKDEETGMYPAIITDTVWLEPVSLQIDFPDGGVDWSFLGGMAPQGPEDSTPLQTEVKEGETVNVTLMGLGCGD